MNLPPPLPGTPPDPEEAAQLAKDLAALRDALVSLALSLRDWQYELDCCGAQESHQLATQMLAPYCGRPADSQPANPRPTASEGS